MAISPIHNVYDGVPFDNRYRVAYQHYLQFGPDFSSTADLNLWSDPWITRDYFPGEYQQENQPANFISLNQYNPNFTISLLASPQVNPFFETVERLPEFMVESKQQKIFGSPIEYTSQSSVVNFERKFADTTYFRTPRLPYNSFPNNCPQTPPPTILPSEPATLPDTTPASKTTTAPTATTPITSFPIRTSTSTSSRSRRGSADASPIIPTTTRTSPTPPTTTASPATRSPTPRRGWRAMSGWKAISRFRAPGSTSPTPTSASTASAMRSNPSLTPNTRLRPPSARTIFAASTTGSTRRSSSPSIGPSTIPSTRLTGRPCSFRRVEQNPNQAGRGQLRSRHVANLCRRRFRPQLQRRDAQQHAQQSVQQPHLQSHAATPVSDPQLPGELDHGNSYNEIDNNAIWSPDPVPAVSYRRRPLHQSQPHLSGDSNHFFR
jgi:hypothetical protein